MGRVTTPMRLVPLFAVALLPASAFAQGSVGHKPTSSGQMSLREAGKAYAKGDLSSATGHISDVLRRAGKTVWEREALYLRALIREKENGDLQRALKDHRHLTTRHPGTAAAAYGQFNIARLYEKMGMTQEAYREYVLCSRLRGLRTSAAATAREDTSFPAMRLTAAGARRLVDLAALRAVRLLGVTARDLDVSHLLPTRTYLMTDPPEPVELPDDKRLRRAPVDDTDLWYLAAPKATAISKVSVAFSAYVDTRAGGALNEKRFSLVIEPCAAAHVAAQPNVLALSGVWRSPRSLVREIRFDPPVRAVKASLYRNGARVTSCTLRATLVDDAPAPAGHEALPGLRTIASPVRGGAGGLSVASFTPFSILAYHAPGPTDEAGIFHDRDMFLTQTSEGRTWSAPLRIRASSATDDSHPSIASLGDGRLLIAFTSDRRGAGSSDLYVSESRDLATWSTPALLEIPAHQLQSFNHKAFVTFHCPVLHVDTRGYIRIFFVAKGFSNRARESRPLSSADYAGLYGVISSDGKKWSKPGAIISSPQTPLDRFRPTPKSTVGKELISWEHRPSVIEISPGRLLAAWITTHGRLLFSRRNEKGVWATENSRVAGSNLTTAATGVALLEVGAERSFKMLLTRRDLGAQFVWSANKLVKSRAVIPGLKALPIELGLPVAVRNLHADGWLTIWAATRASCPSGAYGIDIPSDVGE